MENRRLSLLYNLQNLYNSSKYGTIDYQLSSYLIDNYNQIDHLNIFDVAEDNHVSRATVRRYCQNLGYENFKELKSHFSEFDEGLASYKKFYQGDNFLLNLRLQIKSMFKELEERLSVKELNQIVETIDLADEVMIIASSTIANSIRVFQQTMAIFGKRISIAVSEEELADVEPRLTDKSVILLFSISGLLAQTFICQLAATQSRTYLFTNSRNPIFNQYFDRIYHLTSMENEDATNIIYYTYGITYVLDSIIFKYSERK